MLLNGRINIVKMALLLEKMFRFNWQFIYVTILLCYPIVFSYECSRKRHGSI